MNFLPLPNAGIGRLPHGKGNVPCSAGPEDDEASLGWLGWIDQEKALKRSHEPITLPGGDPRCWVNPNDDFEAEHDGREPDDDMEPEPGELDTADDERRNCPAMMDEVKP